MAVPATEVPKVQTSVFVSIVVKQLLNVNSARYCKDIAQHQNNRLCLDLPQRSYNLTFEIKPK